MSRGIRIQIDRAFQINPTKAIGSARKVAFQNHLRKKFASGIALGLASPNPTSLLNLGRGRVENGNI